MLWTRPSALASLPSPGQICPCTNTESAFHNSAERLILLCLRHWSNIFQDVTLCFQASFWVLWKISLGILLCAYIQRICILLFACTCALLWSSKTCTQQYCHAAYAPSALPFHNRALPATNPASFLHHSSVLANALCEHLVSCSLWPFL